MINFSEFKMKNMMNHCDKKEFVNYEQGLALKELGFDEPCLGYFKQEKLSQTSWEYLESQEKVDYIFGTRKDNILAPLYQSSFKWFREKYNLNSIIIDSKSYDWYFNINDMIKDDVVSEVLYFTSYEEAELDCLKKLIEIAQKRSKKIMKKETVINFRGIELTVFGNYESEEQQVMYDVDLCGTPYSASEFEVKKILTESGDNIYDVFDEEQLSDIRELCLINLEN